MNNLFQNSVLNKYQKQQDKEAIAKAFKKCSKYFHNSAIQQNIRESKEEQFQEGFLRELFVNVLGYTINPDPKFDLTTEFKNEKGAKKADGAILKDSKAIAVIELKGTKTKDLETIRQQAFDYKANQSECIYVITSNFEKIRFYINNAIDFEEFDLFNINEERFSLLYLCLAKENIFNNIPLRIKEDSVQEEEKITKKFYNDYSLFKRELFRDLVKLNMKNEVFRAELNNEDAERGNKNIKQRLFKKSQKLIDRFLFIFFAEDRGLLPPNSTLKILEQWDKLNELDEEVPLYNRFKKYFNFLDQGRKGTDKAAEIFAYNGGLFKPDPVLNSLMISNDLLYKHSRDLSNYDFESQVDVNILGHIFENSLNEIESVNSEIEGTEFDKQKTKRKKDGVFYTPKYITKYIVDNTVGKLCNEKKEELNIKVEEFTPNRQKETKKKLLASLEAYREWLLQLTILDPACGSGAFLNQALDFLITEHQYIDELQTRLLGGGFVFPNIENTVLENNIYGVDLNEESVEIAKLSLWLRTAQPRRKLNDLSSNIKCGNSLIDSKAIAGDKAFKWEEEFTKIFAKGGFDVVIGNPPYGAHLSKDHKKWFKSNYQIAQGIFDTYLFFFEKSYYLLKKDGLTGVISPNTFLVIENGDVLRRFLYERMEVNSYLEVFNVFPDAVVEPIVSIFRKRKKTNNYEFNVKLIDRGAKSIEDVENYSNNLVFKRSDLFENSNLIFNYRINQSEKILLDKINKQSRHIGEILSVKAGVKPYEKGKGTPPQSADIVKEKPFNSFENQNSTWRKVIRGTDVVNHQLKWSGEYINYGEWLAAPRSSSLFSEPKIFMRRTDDKLMCHFDETGMIGINSVHCIFLKDNNTKENLISTSALLNSKLINWVFQIQNFHMIGKPLAEVKVIFVERLPYMEFETKQKKLLQNSAINISNKKSDMFSFQQKFIKYLEVNFSFTEMSKKLQNWHKLEFGNFIKELNKAIKKAGGTPLSKMDEMDWMEVFETKKSEAQALKAEIDKTDKEIDNMVYELYGLNEEEIAIVEGI